MRHLLALAPLLLASCTLDIDPPDPATLPERAFNVAACGWLEVKLTDEDVVTDGLANGWCFSWDLKAPDDAYLLLEGDSPCEAKTRGLRRYVSQPGEGVTAVMPIGRDAHELDGEIISNVPCDLTAP